MKEGWNEEPTWGELSSDQELGRVVVCRGVVYAEMARIIDGRTIWLHSPPPAQCDMCVCIAMRRVARNAQASLIQKGRITFYVFDSLSLML